MVEIYFALRIKTTSAIYGINVTLRGKLWDLGSDGEFIAVSKDSVYTGQPGKGQVWLICILTKRFKLP